MAKASRARPSPGEGFDGGAARDVDATPTPGDVVVLERLRIASDSELRACARVVEVFDWLLRVHVWHQRLPLPVDEAYGDRLAQAPLRGFGPFGKALFCAARSWNPPPVPRPLRSDGEVILAVRRGDDDRGMHALLMAVVAKAPLPLMTALVEAGLDVRVPNTDGFTVLHAAAEVDHPGAVPWLVAQGSPLEARTKHGHTARHVACGLGHLAAARALLDAGADRGASSPTGDTGGGCASGRQGRRGEPGGGVDVAARRRGHRVRAAPCTEAQGSRPSPPSSVRKPA
jgi:hypothetical protein